MSPVLRAVPFFPFRIGRGHSVLCPYNNQVATGFVRGQW
jgi:hypothetical protein